MSKTTKPSKTSIKPFMTYMGGKRRLLPTLTANMPTAYNNYYEPFLGGGALALSVMQNNTKADRKFFLSDYSQDVVDVWNAVKDDATMLAGHIETMMNNHCRTSFMEIRNWDRNGLLSEKTPVEKAARFIYLATTCFGGKIKSNSKGNLAMTYAWKTGKTGNLGAYDYENMFAVSALLNTLDVTIFHASYEAVSELAGYGDFIYLDPPYDPASDTGAVLSSDYLADPVSQGSIRKHIDELTSKGCMTLMSNSDTVGIRELYEGWACSRPQVFWTAGGTNRMGEEILVSNWRLADQLHRNLALAC